MSIQLQRACVIFNKLVVNSLENTSGIFIGTNQAVGWSSCGKSNYGFGTMSDSVLCHSLNVVYDQDVMDASLEEIRNVTLSEAAGPAQQSAVGFQSIDVNALNNASAIGLGEVKPLGWRSTRKSNYGSGKVYGTGKISRTASLIVDNDLVDAAFLQEGQTADAGRTVKNIRIAQNPGAQKE